MSITPKRVSVSHTKFLPPPPKAPLVSWWIDPILQTDRAAFDKQLADSEYQRNHRIAALWRIETRVR